jgi:hypothetical protein
MAKKYLIKAKEKPSTEIKRTTAKKKYPYNSRKNF